MNFLKMVLSILMLMIFTACGGGGSTTPADTPTETGTETGTGTGTGTETGTETGTGTETETGTGTGTQTGDTRGNELAFTLDNSQAIITYDKPFVDTVESSQRRAKVVNSSPTLFEYVAPTLAGTDGETIQSIETISNLLAIDVDGVARSAINSKYPVKVKYTVTSPNGGNLFVVLDPFYTDDTGNDYTKAVALNNCAIYEVNVTSNSSVCVQEGVTVQDMDIEYIKMVGNKKPIQFDDKGQAYFLATVFGVENNTTTASGEKTRLYMYANSSSSAISQDNEDVHFFNTVPNGEVVYYKTVENSTETATSLYIRHADGSVARLTPDNVNYFTLDSNDVVAYSESKTNGIKLIRSLDGDKVQKTILDTTRYEGKSQNTLFADDGNLYSVFESVNSATSMHQVKLYQVLPYDPNPKIVIDLGTSDYHSYSKTPIQISKGYVYYSKLREMFDANGYSIGNASIIYIVRLSTGDKYELLNPDDNDGTRIQLYNWRLSEKQLYFAGLNESDNVVVTGEIDVNKVTREGNPTGSLTIHDSISQSAKLVDAKISDIEIVLPTVPPLDPGHSPQLIDGKGIQLSPTNPHSASMEFSKYMDKASVEKELTYTSNGADVRYMPLWIYKTLHLVPDLDSVPGDEFTTPMIENSEYTIALSNKALDLYDWEFAGASKTVTIDLTAPIITINPDSNGDINPTIYQGADYTDAGASANDTAEGNISANIVTTSNVDTTTLGTYTVKYDVNDSAGHKATQAIRVVTVVPVPDTTNPTLTLNGDSEVSVILGATYIDAGATASDDTDGDLTSSIVVGGGVDTSNAGVYTVTYNVSDSAGNQAIELNRTVTVIADFTGNSSITGVVKDELLDRGLAGVLVTLTKADGTTSDTTTDADGSYMFSSLSHNFAYDLSFRKADYDEATYNDVRMEENETKVIERVNLLKIGTLDGNVSGKIINAVDGSDMGGVTLNIRAGLNEQNSTIVTTLETNQHGEYNATLTHGLYTAETIKNGYVTSYFTIVAIGGELIAYQNSSITPILAEGEMRIILNWGATPSDLDSHLRKSVYDTEKYHLFYASQDHEDANLDWDVVTSYGPETVTISNIDTTATYTYYIYNYSHNNSSELKNSSAKVSVVYNGVTRDFNVPNVDGYYWKVFDIINGAIVSCNEDCVQNPSY